MIAALTKENWDTHNVIRELSRRLGISRNRIGFAGTKDKIAVTTQKISIWDVTEDELARVRIADVSLEMLGRANKPVSLGDLYGNEFEIVIRGIDGQEADISAKNRSVHKRNRWCFWGTQLFWCAAFWHQPTDNACRGGTSDKRQNKRGGDVLPIRHFP